jgi:hypothetical protein
MISDAKCVGATDISKITRDAGWFSALLTLTPIHPFNGAFGTFDCAQPKFKQSTTNGFSDTEVRTIDSKNVTAGFASLSGIV